MATKLPPAEQIEENISNLAKGLREIADKITEQTEEMKQHLPKPVAPGIHHTPGGGKPQ